MDGVRVTTEDCQLGLGSTEKAVSVHRVWLKRSEVDGVKVTTEDCQRVGWVR